MHSSAKLLYVKIGNNFDTWEGNDNDMKHLTTNT